MLTDAEKQRLHGLLRDLMLAFPDWKQKKHAMNEAQAEREERARREREAVTAA